MVMVWGCDGVMSVGADNTSLNNQPQQGKSNISLALAGPRELQTQSSEDEAKLQTEHTMYISVSERNIYPWDERADRKQQKQRII